ncbi:M4 family metallopeptidase [Streptomyces sp. NPDC088124]|uniref:M4 family metallopeptidase n=1 Tax=Streptomyces sp. NPDC088124 TaxID=3154654 RepID=UPI003436B982
MTRTPRSTRAATTAALTLTTLAALTATTLPATASPKSPAPARISATPNPGARPVPVSPEQRADLLRSATRTSPDTARSLKLGAEEKLIPKDVAKDADGTVHTRYERTYAGLPVLGADLVVHRKPEAAPTVTQALDAPLSVPTTTAKITPEEPPGGTRRKVIWAGDGGAPTLAWESVEKGARKDGTPSELHVITDAANGRKLQEFDRIHPGVGEGQYSGRVEIGSIRNGDLYELTDAGRGSHRTYDIAAGGSGVLLTDADDIWGDGTPAHRQTAAVDAAYGAQQTWDFFQERFGRAGIRGDGVGARSRVHYGNGYANAFWNDSCFCMTYGDGVDNARPVTSLDIAAHEMTHGLTYATANLTYSGESGGLNEATSDIMGAAVEFFTDNPNDVPDYLMGELADLRGTGKPLRHMDQPSKDASEKGTSQDHWTPGTRKLDPHFSSGVANHFFYLLAEGSGQKTINGIAYDSPTYDNAPVAPLGLPLATSVWYRALTLYMTSSTDYAGARTATLRAAEDLFGRDSEGYEAVGNAWAAVNVGPRYVNHIAAAAPSTRDAATGQPTTRRIEATTSRPGALTYTATGLPPGLTIDPTTGLISGTPTTAGAYTPTITITTTAHDTLKLPFPWTVLASGGNHFVNPARYDIPNWSHIEAPLTITGHEGNAPTDLKITVDLVHDFIGGQILHLVNEDGTALLVKDFVWDTGTELHTTYTVDASSLPANGTWKLRVTDNTPGIFTVDPGYLDRWSMTF